MIYYFNNLKTISIEIFNIMIHKNLTNNKSNILQYLRIISSNLSTKNSYSFEIFILAGKKLTNFVKIENNITKV